MPSVIKLFRLHFFVDVNYLPGNLFIDAFNFQVPGVSDMPGPAFCPRIETDGNSSEILISSGSEIRLKVMAVHLQVKKCDSIFKNHSSPDAGDYRGNRLYIV